MVKKEPPTRDELVAMQGKKVALTAGGGDGAKIAYHGYVLRVSEKTVIMGMGTTKNPTPVLLAHVLTCVEYAEQPLERSGQR